jgi:Zn-dependent protease
VNETVLTVVSLVLMAYSIILHEIAHGYAALVLGDETALRLGRLTLNPLPHIDPFMTVLLPLMTYVMSKGTFIFGGAKPVPINPAAFRNPIRALALTAAAGPLTNFAIALVFIGLVRITYIAPDNSINQAIFIQLAILNAFLAVFNLIPVLPLDGGRVLTGLLPRNIAMAYARTERFGILGVIVVILLLETAGVLTFLFRYILSAVAYLGGLR